MHTVSTVYYTSFADLKEKLRQIKGDHPSQRIKRLKPHTARVLLKAWQRDAEAVAGTYPTQRPLSYYQRKLKEAASIRAIVEQIAALQPAPGFHSH